MENKKKLEGLLIAKTQLSAKYAKAAEKGETKKMGEILEENTELLKEIEELRATIQEEKDNNVDTRLEDFEKEKGLNDSEVNDSENDNQEVE